MLAIGRALMAAPKVLLLDEPSMGLAPILVEQIFDIIKTINEQGTTVLLVEQNALMALGIANRGYILQTGRDRAQRRGDTPWPRTRRSGRRTSEATDPTIAHDRAHPCPRTAIAAAMDSGKIVTVILVGILGRGHQAMGRRTDRRARRHAHPGTQCAADQRRLGGGRPERSTSASSRDSSRSRPGRSGRPGARSRSASR